MILCIESKRCEKQVDHIFKKLPLSLNSELSVITSRLINHPSNPKTVGVAEINSSAKKIVGEI